MKIRVCDDDSGKATQWAGDIKRALRHDSSGNDFSAETLNNADAEQGLAELLSRKVAAMKGRAHQP